MERSADWMYQAQGDLAHARHDLREGFHDWACFSAQQAAEKAAKAVRCSDFGFRISDFGFRIGKCGLRMSRPPNSKSEIRNPKSGDLVLRTLNVRGLEPHVYAESEAARLRPTLERMARDGVVLLDTASQSAPDAPSRS